MKINLYLGSGLWKKDNWYNHGTTKSVWYNTLSEYKKTLNAGEYKDKEDFILDFDIDLSEMTKFPLNDNSLEKVYTSNMIEHLFNDHDLFLFQDMYRLLKPGGIFRITCPDIDKLYDMYIKNPDKDCIEKNNIRAPKGLNIDSPYEQFMYIAFSYFSKSYKIKDTFLIKEQDVYEEFLNLKKIDENEFNILLKEYGKYGTFEYLRKQSEIYYPRFISQLTGLHINWWNPQKVVQFLINAGFNKIFIYDCNQTNDIEFKSKDFDYTTPEISLYIEAIK